MNDNALQMYQKTVGTSNNETIFVSLVCDFFGIDTENQLDRIKNDHILKNCYGKKPDKMVFGDNYPRIFLTKKGFIRWIDTLNPNIIGASTRENFMVYQSLLFDFMIGSFEKEQTMKIKYLRLRKLQRLQKIIAAEIKTLKNTTENYIEEKFIQGTITFKQLSN